MLGNLALSLCLGCQFLAGPAVDTGRVDVELVLAVDASNSMDQEEFAMQRAGYVLALRDPAFAQAVLAGAEGRIAITYFEWSGSVRRESIVPWQIVDGAESASIFADKLEAQPLGGSGGGTSISDAVAFGVSLLEKSALTGARRVIDISGDGPNNTGKPVMAARDAAVSRGIIINGLPILIRPSQTSAKLFGGLDLYYSNCVTGGPGSFVLPIHDASEFITAIRHKLILEVSGLSAQEATKSLVAAPSDCLIGENLRLPYPEP